MEGRGDPLDKAEFNRACRENSLQKDGQQGLWIGWKEKLGFRLLRNLNDSLQIWF